ncbi:hypothetical protein CA54_41690 [Symmachiella macrocystis]|uniref:Uncharacterized protein n=1 Tax=Symmachiella macrocystis TaxID=2527985 RepID=A0A5C6BAC3_9PLAN|nr:hypothetical protein [Symmachiella macrocystis]TWU08930.1 hypothetical protein CA54_41690 [Symmachiella macrocystis]
MSVRRLADVFLSDENDVNLGARSAAAERLHQIAGSGERSVASLLVDAIAETLGIDAVERLAEAIERRPFCKQTL